VNPVLEAQQRLQTLFGLSPSAAERAVSETLDCFTHTVPEHIQARHRELQAQGLSNADIYQRITDELKALRFCAPELTPRQIRRFIYG
jgi:hypothetical protein